MKVEEEEVVIDMEEEEVALVVVCTKRKEVRVIMTTQTLNLRDLTRIKEIEDRAKDSLREI
jgi:hypothetical protein